MPPRGVWFSQEMASVALSVMTDGGTLRQGSFVT